jgi:hypothetical protein
MGGAGYRTTGTSPVGEGNAAVLAQTTAAQQNAVAQGANMELAGTAQGLTAQGQTQSGYNQAGSMGLTGQGQGISGLNNAAEQTYPMQVPYSNQIIDPTTGQPYSQNGGSSGSLNDAMNNVITGLQNHTMAYSDAQNALSGYGQGGANALTKWASDNNFNIAQSNILAAQQGSITPNLNYANAALQNLKTAMSNQQVWGQNSNIPILGGLANWFSMQTGVGKQQTSTKAGAVGEAQQAIASVLASVKGGTPSQYGAQAEALLPSNPTPADIDAAMANLKALGSVKQDIYGNPGQSNTGGGNINYNDSFSQYGYN